MYVTMQKSFKETRCAFLSILSYFYPFCQGANSGIHDIVLCTVLAQMIF